MNWGAAGGRRLVSTPHRTAIHPSMPSLAHAVTVFDRKSRVPDYAFVQRQLVKDLPYYFLCQLDEVDVIPSSLRGYERPLLSPFNSIARWRYAE